MYLIICKSKVTGLSIHDYTTTRHEAEVTIKRRNESMSDSLQDLITLHVRKINWNDIDLEKLMENE